MPQYDRLKNLIVLYIEDEIDVREEIVEMLEMKVGKLYIASNGQEGLEIYNHNKIDIIITDIKMPIMDGMTMIENIRQKDEMIPIIVTTAFNEISFLKKAIDLHIDKYITKPINFSQLLSVLNRASEVIFQKKELAQKDLMLKNKEKLEIISELIENIAHQWRQPLSIISTAASGMQMQKEYNVLTDEKFNESCEIINQNAQNLSDTIDSFRDFFDKDETEVELNFNDIVDDCLNIIKKSYESKNIQIVQNVEDVSILGVKNHLIQIFLTILSNAKDILLTIEDENKYIFIDIKKEKQNILISIKDNGGGIKEKNVSRVFEPYFTTKHQFQGTGLGLYAVYEIVKKSLKGDIQVQNVEFEYQNIKYIGAEFLINLPV